MMYTAFCENCESIVSCSVNIIKTNVEVRGATVEAEQMVGHCPHCGNEVFPNEAIDFNVLHAHDAYRDHVGAIRSSRIQELLDRYDIGAEPLGDLLGWGANTISRQMKYVVPDRDHSRRLESLFDVNAMERLVAENGDRLSRVAREKVERRIRFLKGDSSDTITENEKTLAVRFPYNEMRKMLGCLPDTRKRAEKVIALRKFFHVDSLEDALSSIFGAMINLSQTNYAFRMDASAESKIDIYGLAAWLRAGEDIASEIACASYDAERLKNALPALRQITCHDDMQEIWHETVALLNSCGVKLVAVPYLRNTRVNGSVKWINGNPVIMLNAKGKRMDIVWFTLFHEIGHILLHDHQCMDIQLEDADLLNEILVDEAADREAQADTFARTSLISDQDFNILKETLSLVGGIRKDVIFRFARRIHICPDIVIGRMAHENMCAWSHSICQNRRTISISNC